MDYTYNEYANVWWEFDENDDDDYDGGEQKYIYINADDYEMEII